MAVFPLHTGFFPLSGTVFGPKFPAPAFVCGFAGAKFVMRSSARIVTKITVDRAYMDGLMPRRTSL